MSRGNISEGLSDIRASFIRYNLALILGWQDVSQRYKRSALGPFWLTISMGVMIGTMGLVFGQIFKTPMQEFLPFLCLGIIFWGFISNIVNESCSAFIASEGIIKHLPLPLFTQILRVIWRNLIILAHNLVIVPVVLLAVGRPVDLSVLLFLPGVLLVVVNVGWVSLILATICSRYRDLPQIIGSLMQVLFYLSPVMWLPKLLPQDKAFYLLQLNPLAHLLEVLRSPFMSQEVTLLSWHFCVVMAVIGWALAIVFFSRYKKKIAYWL